MSLEFEQIRGSITLFTAVILLPIVFLLLTLSLDLTQMYSNRNAMQRLIDEAALHGYRFLPFQQQARFAVSGYLQDLNMTGGSFESRVSSDAVEITYHGTAPFTFAAFAGMSEGLPYELTSRVRSTVVHAALLIDSGAVNAPADQNALWGEEHAWPAARLFTHFEPFGAQVSPRYATQQCHNPLFTSIKRAGLGIFDFLSSFSKNSVAVAYYPGTLSQIDIIKDARRPGREATGLSVGYFNVANSPVARNSYCLAINQYESLESPYRIPAPENFQPDYVDSDSFFTDPENHLVNEMSLSEISVRETIWSRAIRVGGPSSIRLLLGRVTDLLAEGGDLNPFEKQNRIAERPVKVGVIVTSYLPSEGDRVFPATEVKESIRDELLRFYRAFAGDSSSGVAGRLYFVILQHPERGVNHQSVRSLQAFINQTISEFSPRGLLSMRIVLSTEEGGASAGVLRSLVLENNTAVIDG